MNAREPAENMALIRRSATDRVQPDLFGPALLPGLRYMAGIIDEDEERALAARVTALPFAPFQFQGFEGKRRIASFGLRYDFSRGRAEPAESIPGWALALRERAAEFAGLAPAALEQLLVTEYAPGAPIGWHRDRPLFDKVVGVSLLAPATLRFRRRTAGRWERSRIELAPRSAYLISGEARDAWEHSIPEQEQLRYLLTFRSLR